MATLAAVGVVRRAREDER